MNTAKQSSIICRPSLPISNVVESRLWLAPRRGINRLHNVPGFIALWDLAPARAQAWRYRLRRSPYGNINGAGRAGDLSAPALAYWHPQFVSSIENGVRPLVLALTDGGRWISYTSCAGHEYAHLALPCSERHVGLLPRNADEYTKLSAFLRQVVATAGVQDSSAAYPGLVAGTLADHDRTWAVIDFYIAKRVDVRWTKYFAELDWVTTQLTHAIQTYPRMG